MNQSPQRRNDYRTEYRQRSSADRTGDPQRQRQFYVSASYAASSDCQSQIQHRPDKT
ncbi:hypothetical protein CFL01nite_02490 [Corynebacterium flavescens]|uniref:Uncharacterized protein n=1 Tax=Corynebacterium flavescens TaxID=28028 RepID=A0AB73B522_CORFL|nr:hypothetical protein CFL01nite_02490 [Corynebacterium flavescens]